MVVDEGYDAGSDDSDFPSHINIKLVRKKVSRAFTDEQAAHVLMTIKDYGANPTAGCHQLKRPASA
jgi:hypothetical protein